MPVGTSNSTIPAVKNALAAKASRFESPASSRKIVLIPQMNDAASVFPSVNSRYVRWTARADGMSISIPTVSSGRTHRSACVPRRELPAAASREPLGVDRAPAALRVRLRCGRLREQRRGDLPHALDAVSAREERLVADQRVVEQALVRGQELVAVFAADA